SFATATADRLPREDRVTSGRGRSYAIASVADCWDWLARFRCVALRIFLRRRRFLGVASTYSSDAMYSRARSKLILRGGSSWMPFPSPWLRILVRCLVLVGLTGISSARGFSPTIIPS